MFWNTFTGTVIATGIAAVGFAATGMHSAFDDQP
jgi:hypothetical protein